MEFQHKPVLFDEKMCIRDRDIDDRQMDRTAAIILSMTPEEREKPALINPSRKRRIAAGSGMKVEDVNKMCIRDRNCGLAQ